MIDVHLFSTPHTRTFSLSRSFLFFPHFSFKICSKNLRQLPSSSLFGRWRNDRNIHHVARSTEKFGEEVSSEIRVDSGHKHPPWVSCDGSAGLFYALHRGVVKHETAELEFNEASKSRSSKAAFSLPWVNRCWCRSSSEKGTRGSDSRSALARAVARNAVHAEEVSIVTIAWIADPLPVTTQQRGKVKSTLCLAITIKSARHSRSFHRRARKVHYRGGEYFFFFEYFFS